MVIANPIYDVAFKFLMEDEKIAKFFIGTLLNETIEEVVVKPQEYAFIANLESSDPKIRTEAKAQLADRISISVFRLDFVATIRTANGELKKVLVEIQKAKNSIDLMRFRNYLGEQYKKEDEISGKKIPLPIVTIYLLGFKLPEIESSIIKVNRQYLDLLTSKVIERKSDFIEKLTHDCYVVQLSRIEARVETKLEKLLSVFEQHYFVDDNNILKEYNHKIDDENIHRIIEKLHYVGTEPAERKKIEDEKEAHRVMDWATEAKTQELLSTIEEQNKALDDKDQLIEELKRKLGEK
ncbi:MAG TPA: hypothetical protein VF691_03745 [Cytophagaceae bacterium]